MIEFDQYHRDEQTLIVVTMSGRLSERELKVFQPQFESEIRHHRDLRLLFRLSSDLSWEPRSNWRGLSFDSRHRTSVARLAVVGADPAWRRWVLKACAPLSSHFILSCNTRRLDQAQKWLAGRSVQRS